MAKRRFSSIGGVQLKYTITLTTDAYPSGIKFPVASKPADVVAPQFRVADRRIWRQDEWVMGWGQRRFVDKERFWYGTVNSFRNNELSAGAKLISPATDITAAGVKCFAEYTNAAGTTTLYAAAGSSLYSYNFSTETWSVVSGCATTSRILDVRALNGVLYVTQNSGIYYTLTDTTWAAGTALPGGASAGFFASRSDTGTENPTAPVLYVASRNKVYWGASWANSATVSGSGTYVYALVTFKNDLYAIKEDGLYVMAKTSETTAKFLPVQEWAACPPPNLMNQPWAQWNDRLWFRLGTSLASFDGVTLRLVEYPWAVAPTDLYDLCSLCAMDDALLVGFRGYALAYHDHGADKAGDWHYAMTNSGKRFQAMWFTRIPTQNRVFYGMASDSAWSTGYSIMQSGLFMPNTFATSSVYYSSIFDDGDETVNKWAAQLIVYCENCDANNTVQFAYSKDGGSFVNIGSPITAAGYSILPSSTTYITDGSGNKVSFRSIQLKATITTAGSTVTPIIKSTELIFVPIRPDKRRLSYTLLCGDEWEVGSESAKYTAKQYWDALWSAANQSTPITLTDEFGTSYTVMMNMSGSPIYTDEGTVTAMMAQVSFSEP